MFKRILLRYEINFNNKDENVFYKISLHAMQAIYLDAMALFLSANHHGKHDSHLRCSFHKIYHSDSANFLYFGQKFCANLWQGDLIHGSVITSLYIE